MGYNKAKKIITLDEFKDKHYGKTGTVKRDKFEEGYKNFKVGAMILEARLKNELTPEATNCQKIFDSCQG